jgi:tRNA A37 methylthiotransferase MiaB
VAQQEGEAIQAIPGRGRCRRWHAGHPAPSALINQAAEKEGRRDRAIDLNPYDDVTFPLGGRAAAIRSRHVVHHHREGCNEFCSFCVVPYAWP